MPNSRAPGVTPRSVAMPDEMWEAVRREAEWKCTTAGALIRELIEKHLKGKR